MRRRCSAPIATAASFAGSTPRPTRAGIALSPLMSEALAAAGALVAADLPRLRRELHGSAGRPVARRGWPRGAGPPRDEISTQPARAAAAAAWWSLAIAWCAPCPRLALDLGGIAKGFLVDRHRRPARRRTGSSDVADPVRRRDELPRPGAPWRPLARGRPAPRAAWTRLVRAGVRAAWPVVLDLWRRTPCRGEYGVAVAHLVDPPQRHAAAR